MVPVAHRPAGEEPDADYPYWFTTGRLREHYNSGAQTRRVGRLAEAAAEPRAEIHPFLARRLGLAPGDRIAVESRRGAVTLVPAVSAEIRPDTVFAPFHWGGRRSANALTSAALDPVSRMPEFKVCAVRVRRVEARAA
jgi:assimilatory nitrate reductase catalytic subunit